MSLSVEQENLFFSELQFQIRSLKIENATEWIILLNYYFNYF